MEGVAVAGAGALEVEAMGEAVDVVASGIKPAFRHSMICASRSFNLA